MCSLAQLRTIFLKNPFKNVLISQKYVSDKDRGSDRFVGSNPVTVCHYTFLKGTLYSKSIIWNVTTERVGSHMTSPWRRFCYVIARSKTIPLTSWRAINASSCADVISRAKKWRAMVDRLVLSVTKPEVSESANRKWVKAQTGRSQSTRIEWSHRRIDQSRFKSGVDGGRGGGKWVGTPVLTDGSVFSEIRPHLQFPEWDRTIIYRKKHNNNI